MAAKVQHFFDMTKLGWRILQILLQNKSTKANWINWTNWTPDARGWTPGGPEGRGALQNADATGWADNPEGLEGRGDKPDSIRRNGQTNKQTKLCADAQRTQQRND